MLRTQNQHKRLFQLLNILGVDEDARMTLVRQYTGGRTSSTKELTTEEAKKLIAALEEQEKESVKRMRGKIINLLTTLPEKPMILANGQADYVRINTFISGIGSANPRKVILNFLYVNELPAVVTQVEQIWKKQSNAQQG